MSTKEGSNAGKRPPNAGKGRPPGIPNKTTGALKEMILGALAAAGGQAYLEARAKDPRTQQAFLGLVGKVLPMTVTGPEGGPLKVVIQRFAGPGA